eukprot:gene24293-9894_t
MLASRVRCSRPAVGRPRTQSLPVFVRPAAVAWIPGGIRTRTELVGLDTFSLCATNTMVEANTEEAADVGILNMSAVQNNVAKITVMTLKGQVLDRIDADCNTTTVRQLKQYIADRTGETSLDSMKLVYNGKYMTNETLTLTQAGVKPRAAVTMYLVSRFLGGGGYREQEIMRQLRRVEKAELPNVELITPDEDVYKWNLLPRGPAESPYAQGLFSVTISFPGDYPEGEPCLKFNTPIFHPNVYTDGRVCWECNDYNGDAYQAEVVIAALLILFVEPNSDNPANSEAAYMYVHDRTKYNQRARKATAKLSWS